MFPLYDTYYLRATDNNVLLEESTEDTVKTLLSCSLPEAYQYSMSKVLPRLYDALAQAHRQGNTDAIASYREKFEHISLILTSSINTWPLPYLHHTTRMVLTYWHRVFHSNIETPPSVFLTPTIHKELCLWNSAHTLTIVLAKIAAIAATSIIHPQEPPSSLTLACERIILQLNLAQDLSNPGLCYLGFTAFHISLTATNLLYPHYKEPLQQARTHFYKRLWQEGLNMLQNPTPNTVPPYSPLFLWKTWLDNYSSSDYRPINSGNFFENILHHTLLLSKKAHAYPGLHLSFATHVQNSIRTLALFILNEKTLWKIEIIDEVSDEFLVQILNHKDLYRVSPFEFNNFLQNRSKTSREWICSQLEAVTIHGTRTLNPIQDTINIYVRIDADHNQFYPEDKWIFFLPNDSFLYISLQTSESLDQIYLRLKGNYIPLYNKIITNLTVDNSILEVSPCTPPNWSIPIPRPTPPFTIRCSIQFSLERVINSCSLESSTTYT